MKPHVYFLIILFLSLNLSAQEYDIFGTTQSGGVNNAGVIYATNGDLDNYEVVYKFPSTSTGGRPINTQMIKLPNGTFIGSLAAFGANSLGVLYTYNVATGAYEIVYHFEDNSIGAPTGRMNLTNDGKLIGVCSVGGSFNRGGIFEYNIATNTFIVKNEFEGGEDGFQLSYGMMMSSNGKMYGSTQNGGTNNNGTLFEFDPISGERNIIHHFNGANGQLPVGIPLQLPNGDIYGCTLLGGGTNSGLIYKIDPITNNVTTEMEFDDDVKGKRPSTGLTYTSNGKIFGVTQVATGTSGSLYEFDPVTNTYAKRAGFTGIQGGRSPSEMIEFNGKLYGAAPGSGGFPGKGTIYEFDPATDNISILHSFEYADGSRPSCTLSITDTNNLIGVTSNGGSRDVGSIFSYNLNTAQFNREFGFEECPMGTGTRQKMIAASNGKLYGTTYYGGANGKGVIFEVDPITSIFTKKADFTELIADDMRSEGLVEVNGKLYGISYRGGQFKRGSIFSYDLQTEILALEHSFNANTNGFYPDNGLFIASNGKLYGSCLSFGANNRGTIFEFDPATGILVKKIDLENNNYALGIFKLGQDGSFYTITRNAGVNYRGAILRYNPVTNILTTLYDFPATGIAYPSINFVITNGILYGSSSTGGFENGGIIFSFDLSTNLLTELLANQNYSGYQLKENKIDDNSKILGFTQRLPEYPDGILFDYDILTNSITIKKQFNGDDGRTPFQYEGLTHINRCPQTTIFTATGWENGIVPTNGITAILDAPYDTSVNGNLEACSLIVNETATLTVRAGDFLNISNSIMVNGTLDVEHEGSLVQINNRSGVYKGPNGVINVNVTTPILKPRDFIISGSPMAMETRDGVYENSFRVLEHSTLDFFPHPLVDDFYAPNTVANFMDDNFNDWSNYVGIINPAEGYLVYPQASILDGNSTYDLDFTEGTLNNGIVKYVMDFHVDKNSSPNIISNPYASAIDAEMFINANDEIDEVYFWEHITTPDNSFPGGSSANFNMEDISMYNLSGGIGVGTAANNGGAIPNGIIATSQGFGVKATAEGTATFNNAMRVTTGNTTLRAPIANRNRIWLEIESMQYGFSSETLIAFSPEATSLFDAGYDSDQIGRIVSLYSHLPDGTMSLGIQGREAFNEDIMVSMGCASQINDNAVFKIKIKNIDGDEIETSVVYLVDTFNGTITNLSQIGSYTFTSAKGNFPNRFILQFKNEEILDTMGQELSKISVMPNPTNGLLFVNSPSSIIKNISVVDMQGRIIKMLENIESFSSKLDISTMQSAVFFINIKTESGTIVKRVIKN